MGTLRIVSRSDEPFRDRREAGRLLGEALLDLRGQNAVVLGIPRGGIIVAQEAAHVLDAELDVVISRKLRSPVQPELAMGAISENGSLFLNEALVRELGISSGYIDLERAAQLAEIARRAGVIRHILPKVLLEGRVAIVTDDGVATGATTQAALWAVRQERPRKLIAAIPVGPEETIRRLAADVDEMVCLRMPPFIMAVGQFYTRFEQIEDEEMLQILREEARRKVRK